VAFGDLRTIFARSWDLFVHNLTIVLPGFVAAGIAAFFEIVIVPADASASDAQIVLSHTLALLAHIFTTVVAIAFTTGMADAAWRSGHSRLGDGLVALRREGGHVFVAVIALLALGLLAALLASWTFGITIGLYAYFCLYTMPSAVVGERPGLVAVGESAMIAFRRPLATVVILVAVSAIALAFGRGAEYLQLTPYVGSLLGPLVVQAVIAYATLILVGEYRVARQMEPVL
jgi:hypothetical protein